jgi:BlaI family transcriptional regulator, penicillinase repressor
MARKATEGLTPVELEVMKALWSTGAANVQAIQQAMARELAYTTVQTVLNILTRKGKVKRTLKERAYFYRAAVSREEVARRSVRDLVDRFFGGSSEDLVLSLVESRDVTAETVSRLKSLIEARGKGGNGKR